MYKQSSQLNGGVYVPNVKEPKETLEAIKQAAESRGISQSRLVRRGLVMVAPELREVFTERLI